MGKSIYMKRYMSACATLMLCGLSASTFAASTWNQNLVDTCNTPSVGSNSVACGSSPVSTVSGWSTAPDTSAGAAFAAAKVFEYSTGLGVVGNGESSTSNGQHAIDNVSGTDALMLSFANSVTLSSMTIGWDGTDNRTGSYTDSDISVFAWTGSSGGQTAPSPAAFKPNAMSGWTLIGNFGNVGNKTVGSTGLGLDTQSWTTSLTSSYWLISAYNSAYGNVSANGQALNGSNDAFKLYSIAGSTQPPAGQTPEPGSLALLGLGLMGVVAARRRKQASM